MSIIHHSAAIQAAATGRTLVAGTSGGISGFDAGVPYGSITDNQYAGFEIREIRSAPVGSPAPTDTQLFFRLRGTSAPPPSSVFTSITIPALGFSLWARAAASDPNGAVSGNDRFWTWFAGQANQGFLNGSTYSVSFL